MNLIADLKELLLPRCCPVCNKLLMRGEDVMCAFCAIGFPRFRSTDIKDNSLLRRLWDWTDIKHATTFFSYNHFSPYHNLVIDFKFHGKSDLAVKMGRWAAMEAMKSGFWDEIDALVPVPLTRWRKWQRGYNQAELLARGMSEVTGLPVVNLLRRTENRISQTQLSNEQRRKNAEGIYRASRLEGWRGKHLLLVDDVMTTGSTLANCALALRDAEKGNEISVFPLTFAY
ncbi:MAG: ComF family protein [Prevotellaceae bacterium]|nr:ComF family protein [Prevotellaceae bacterium]